MFYIFNEQNILRQFALLFIFNLVITNVTPDGFKIGTPKVCIFYAVYIKV